MKPLKQSKLVAGAFGSYMLLTTVMHAIEQRFVIETVAGYGAPEIGDEGPATSAVLERAAGVVAAPDGSFYIADTYNDRVRLVRPNGVITTFVGTGSGETRDFGDGLLASQAQLRLPRSVKVAPDGSLWIADTNNYRVRRVGSDGVIRTMAGGGGSGDNPPDNVPAIGALFAAPMDVAVEADGTFYIADLAANRIRRVGTDGVIRAAAQVSQPQSIAFDGRGGLLIASSDGGAIRRLDLVTGAVSSIGEVRGRFVTVDGAGNVVFSSGNQVFRRDARTSEVTLVAGRGGPSGFAGDGGPARDATLDDPQRLSVASDGAIFIAEAGNDRIRRVASDGRITTVAGNGQALADGVRAERAAIYDSQGLAIDTRGNLYFTDFLHSVIRRIDAQGIVRTVAGGRRARSLEDDVHPLSAFIGTPSKLTFDRGGNLMVLDESGSVGVVRTISPGADGLVDGSADERIRTVAGQYRPRAEADRGRADGGPARQAVFDAARAITLDSQGRLFVADVLDARIRMVTPGADGVLNGAADEIISTIAGTGISQSTGDGGPAYAASLLAPGGYGSLAIDVQDNVYVIENTRRLRRIDMGSGIIDTVSNFQRSVWSITFDRDGWGYLAESTRMRRFHFSAIGEVENIAGTGEAGFRGDGGPASEALLRGAQFPSIDARGDIYFPDNGNFRLRRLRRP